jgi:hypothetical protein
MPLYLTNNQINVMFLLNGKKKIDLLMLAKRLDLVLLERAERGALIDYEKNIISLDEKHLMDYLVLLLVNHLVLLLVGNSLLVVLLVGFVIILLLKCLIDRTD